ncbi:DUF5753 domain-containing protein [Streptomyces canus]|uniref:DUF5753 domain-containing protein n=1 Tax=Streptomyces canus TaxID=58343 RepID=UPI003F540A5F
MAPRSPCHPPRPALRPQQLPALRRAQLPQNRDARRVRGGGRLVGREAGWDSWVGVPDGYRTRPGEGDRRRKAYGPAMATDRAFGWWESYREVLPSGLLDLAELEHYATAIRTAYTSHMPGLLQTADHAREIFRHVIPEPAPPEIEHRVSHRIKRQGLLYGADPTPYRTTVHEAALHMRVGGRDVARAQLRHLLDTAQLDQFHGPVLLNAEALLTKYRNLLDIVEATALGPEKSRDLIHSIAQNL